MTLLKTDFYKALEAGHLIRRCEFCKKYFITSTGYHTKYCSNPALGRTDISLNELENRLKSANLCKECNVVRKANPVGKPKKKPAAEVKL